MSVALGIENSEVLQHDPARAGIFNPENSPSVQMIVDKLTDVDATANALKDVKLSERQLLMVGALIAANGQLIIPRDIIDPFPGPPSTNKNRFFDLTSKISRSRYRPILHKEPLPEDRRITSYKWGEQVYSPVLEPEVQRAFWSKIGGVTLRIRRPEQVKPAQDETFDRKPVMPTSLPEEFLNDDADYDWREKALCAQTDSEAFFPEKGGSTREAKRTCLSCDVRDDCLNYAVMTQERFGIWGGLSERERRKLLRRAV